MSYEDFNSNTFHTTGNSSAVTVLFKAGLEMVRVTPWMTSWDSRGRVCISFDLANTGNGTDSLFLSPSNTEWITSGSSVTTSWTLIYNPRDFAAGERRGVIAQTIILADALDYYGGTLEILAISKRDTSVTGTIAYEILVLAPILTLVKYVDKESALPGDTMTYMFRIQNEGHGRATSAVKECHLSRLHENTRRN